MAYECVDIQDSMHRLIPSRFPPVQLFDWAASQAELEEIAALEGLTNDRLLTELGNIYLVDKSDWIGGPGSTALMAAFTHPGLSRFSDGSYGVYYAAESIDTAIAETKYHRERFLSASYEQPCFIQMREYKVKVKKPLVNISHPSYSQYLDPDLARYPVSQSFGCDIRNQKEWGLKYPSVRRCEGYCVAIFRPPALEIPVQAGHYDYIWDGRKISEVTKATPIQEI